MNCRQYINAVNNRACGSNHSFSHHKEQQNHFAGRRYYYLPHNPSVLSGKRYRAGSSVDGKIKRSEHCSDAESAYHIYNRKVASMLHLCYLRPQLHNHNTYNSRAGTGFYSFIASTRF